MRKNLLPELKTDRGRRSATSIRRNCAYTTRSKRREQSEKSSGDRSSGRLHDDTILVPIDFTTASYKALDYALSMAKKLNWSIALVHVVVRSYAEGFVDSIPKTELRAEAHREAHRKLNALVPSKTRGEVSIRSIVRDGLPEYEILRIAESTKVKMIVLGRQDRNPLSRLIFGSVTREILDAARFPVLVINSDVDFDTVEVGGFFSINREE